MFKFFFLFSCTLLIVVVGFVIWGHSMWQCRVHKTGMELLCGARVLITGSPRKSSYPLLINVS